MKFIYTLILMLFISNVYADAIDKNVERDVKEFYIELDANPTTGYEWQVKDYDQKLLQVKEIKYIPQNPQLIGSGGKTQVNFSVIGEQIPDNTKVILIYKRPWEEQPETSEVININFINSDNN